MKNAYKVTKVLLSIPDKQLEYVDKMAKRELTSRSHVLRLIITNYIKNYPRGETLKDKEEIIENIPEPQNTSIEEIVDEIPRGDISQICDHASCSNKDVRSFNLQVEKDGDIELELRLYCPEHYVEAVNNGDKLELLE